jgi:hypothetical protein
MATVVRHELLHCEGFRIESADGLVGWVEETWFGPDDQPAAFAVRTIDGRDALLLAEDVGTVFHETEHVVMTADARLLELDVPRLTSASGEGLAASWRTTGNVLEPPDPPGLATRLLLDLRPWRLTPPPRAEVERPLWVTLTLVYVALTVIVGLLIGLDFLAAALAT